MKRWQYRLIASPYILLICLLSVDIVLECTEYDEFNPSYCLKFEELTGVNFHFGMLSLEIGVLIICVLVLPIMLFLILGLLIRSYRKLKK